MTNLTGHTKSELSCYLQNHKKYWRDSMTLKTLSYDTETLIEDISNLGNKIYNLLESLDKKDWFKTTFAEGWTILDTVGHLAFFDKVMQSSLMDHVDFEKIKSTFMTSSEDPMKIHLDYYRLKGPEITQFDFKENSNNLLGSFLNCPDGTLVDWFGPAMKLDTAIISRIMEYWAHSQDIYDGLNLLREREKSLIYIAELGVKTFKWSFFISGLEEPKEKLLVNLTDNDRVVSIGHTEAVNIIEGPLEDFCLLVTQRRNRRNLSLTAYGKEADTFLDIAQCFAGSKGSGRS